MLRTNQTPISSTNQGLVTEQNPDRDVKLKFKAFLKEFNLRNERIYHDRVMSHLNLQRLHLQVQLLHLKSFDEYLFDLVKDQPLQWIRILQKTLEEYVQSIDGRETRWQLQLTSEEQPIRLRQINSYSANKLITTSGIVVKATRPFIKGKRIALKCNRCANRMTIECQIGQSPQIPRKCVNSQREIEPCGLDSLKILSHDSTVQNYQKIILEEYPEDIPKGQTPRTYELMLERHNSGVLTPGERVRVTGVLLLKERQRGIKGGYLWGCGMYRDRQTQDQKFSIEEEEQFKLFSKDPNLHQKIYSYIAPKIFGNKDIKEAISCQLFGGSRKTLPDNTKLRGDINVLLVGDPSTAKSQFLIFAQKLSAISVYTSGKGSSAAGLTASINKDPSSGEFQVEAGALVRADGGLVCIDQFDKMRPQDRVAIHEAMQQQTISVAKAGITSRLNSRCSILAAANPIMGRYDDFKQITEQINLLTTILSRFDCIFIVRDQKDPEHDADMVSHVLDLHINRASDKSRETDLQLQFLRKYIAYARQKIHPRLTTEASERLKRCFIEDRKESVQHRLNSKQSIPITVRQLQAIIRISQSLARMQLRSDVRESHVNEAHRLFKASTLSSIRMEEIRPPKELTEQIMKVEEAVKRRVPMETEISIKKLAQQLKDRFSDSLIQFALRNLVVNGYFRQADGGKKLIRQR